MTDASQAHGADRHSIPLLGWFHRKSGRAIAIEYVCTYSDICWRYKGERKRYVSTDANFFKNFENKHPAPPSRNGATEGE